VFQEVRKTERRRYQRYSPPEGTIAVLRPYGEEIGLIKNISKGGLVFQYLILENKKGSILTEPEKEIDIFHPEDKFHLARIPCIIVWEHDLQFEHSAFTAVPTRLVGVSFDGLNRDKTSLFYGFLARCK